MIDLNAHFIRFAREKISLFGGGKLSAKGQEGGACDEGESQTQMLRRLYAEWEGTSFDDLGDITPLDFVARFGAEQLVDMLAAFECELVVERLKSLPESEKRLTELLQNSQNGRVRLDCIEVLSAFKNEPLDVYIDIVTEGDEGLREPCIDRLKACADAARPLLLAAANLPANSENNEFLEIVGEVLLCGERHEDSYNFLVDLFARGHNIPMCAGFLGAYGDERAAAVLYPALDTADFVDYIEIKNAIERLGGLVDDNMRDFSSDPLFRLLKGETKND